jgi:hypothetical protein
VRPRERQAPRSGRTRQHSMTSKDTVSYQALTWTVALPLDPWVAWESSVGGSTSCRFPPNARLSPPPPPWLRQPSLTYHISRAGIVLLPRPLRPLYRHTERRRVSSGGRKRPRQLYKGRFRSEIRTLGGKCSRRVPGRDFFASPPVPAPRRLFPTSIPPGLVP